MVGLQRIELPDRQGRELLFLMAGISILLLWPLEYWSGG
jgi:hypothetical protein